MLNEIVKQKNITRKKKALLGEKKYLFLSLLQMLFATLERVEQNFQAKIRIKGEGYSGTSRHVRSWRNNSMDGATLSEIAKNNIGIYI